MKLSKNVFFRSFFLFMTLVMKTFIGGESPKNSPCRLKSKGEHHTFCIACWCILYCTVCSVLSLSSLGNGQLGPCVHPMGGVHISWMASSEHSEGFLMSLSVLLGSLCLKMAVLSLEFEVLRLPG